MAKYYIDNVNGSDTVGDGSYKSPYATLSKIYTGNILIGDNVVMLRSGTHVLPSALLTAIPANSTLKLVGQGPNTIISIVEDCRNWTKGNTTATLEFDKLCFTTQYMNAYTINLDGLGNLYNYYMTITCKLRFRNVVFLDCSKTSYGAIATSDKYFFRSRNTIEIINCTAAFTKNVLTFNTQRYLIWQSSGNVYVYNSYNVYGNNTAWTVSSNNAWSNTTLTNSLIDSTSFKLLTPQNNVDLLGVYFGDYSWATNGFVIYQGGKYYSPREEFYNSTTKTFNEITLGDVRAAFDYYALLSMSELTSEVTFGTDTFIPFDKFDNFRIVTQALKNIRLIGTKTDTELIVQGWDINPTRINKINTITTTCNESIAGSIKVVFSTDKGTTWRTVTSGAPASVDCIIPLKAYETMTESEKEQFNLAKTTISSNGFTTDVFNSFDFNTLNAESLRFAFVINRPLYTDTTTMTSLTWNYDEKAYQKLLTDSECITEIFGNYIRITSNITDSKLTLNIVV